MTLPDNSTILVIIVNISGWAFTIVHSYWRNSQLRWQHKAMWRTYAKEHGIPTNGTKEE